MINSGNSNESVPKRRYSKSVRFAIKLCISLLIAIILNIAITSFTDTPKMLKIRQENQRLEDKYSVLKQKIASAQRTIDDIIQRDQQIYRPLLGIDSLHIAEIYAEYNNSKYASLAEDEIYGSDIYKTWLDLDRLSRRVYYSSLCLDETQALAENKEEFSLVIPAIFPIDRTKLRRVSSPYGYRVHPVLRYRVMHEGVDLAAPTGTEVYATGNGTIVKAGKEPSYGNFIEINHGFGYRTRYAHLSKIFVHVGDSVKRGHTIGYVGSTGRSTGPHLHYEVCYRGTPVNPESYYDKNQDTTLIEQLKPENSDNNERE